MSRNRFNGKLVLHSDTVYYRNPPTSKAAIGASNSSQPLIDYDSLPDGTIIPNGGFNSTSQIPGYTTAKISVNGSLPTDPSTGLPSDWENRRKQRRRSTVNLEGRQTIKTASLPIGFIGTMTHLFFGGSTVAWASPKLQYAYLNQVSQGCPETRHRKHKLTKFFRLPCASVRNRVQAKVAVVQRA